MYRAVNSSRSPSSVTAADIESVCAVRLASAIPPFSRARRSQTISWFRKGSLPRLVNPEKRFDTRLDTVDRRLSDRSPEVKETIARDRSDLLTHCEALFGDAAFGRTDVHVADETSTCCRQRNSHMDARHSKVERINRNDEKRTLAVLFVPARGAQVREPDFAPARTSTLHRRSSRHVSPAGPCGPRLRRRDRRQAHYRKPRPHRDSLSMKHCLRAGARILR